MKYFKRLLIIFLSFILLNAFRNAIKLPDVIAKFRIADDPTHRVLGLLTNEDPYTNYVALTFSQTATPVGYDSAYTIGAFARFSNGGQNLDMGPLSINTNRTILPDAENLYHFNFSGADLGEGKTFYGSDVQIDVAEPDPGYRTTGLRKRTVIAVPKDFYPSTLNLPTSSIRRGQDYPLQWNPDPNNQYQKVLIEVIYYKGLSQLDDPGMPDQIENLSYRVPDNGNFTIPATDLNRFPTDATVAISISRVWMISSSNNVAYLAIVNATSVPLLVFDIASYSISGPSALCSNGQYSINAPSSVNLVWTVSGIAGASVSPANASPTTVSVPNGSTGTLTLAANLTGGSPPVTKQIYVGPPAGNFSYNYNGSQLPMQFYVSPGSENAVCMAQYTTTSVDLIDPSLVGTWSLVYSNYAIDWNQGLYAGHPNDLRFYLWNPNHRAIFRFQASNGCGSIDYSYGFKAVDCSGGGGGGCFRFQVLPNPVNSDGSLVVIVPGKPAPCSKTNDAASQQQAINETINEVRIYDFSGNIKTIGKFGGTKQASINIKGLKAGNYYLKIFGKQIQEIQPIIIH